MDASSTLWELEARFWSGDAEFYAEHLAQDCVMAFPPPAGIMSREEIVDSISGARRWRTVAFRFQRELWLDESAVLLVYSALAERDGEPAPYRVAASSAYRKRGAGWELVFHQQTPLASEEAA